MVKTEFAHIGISCLEPAVIEGFYTSYFGFKRTRLFKTDKDEIIMLRAGSVYLELFQAKQDSPLPPASGAGPEYPGFRHISFSVDDIDIKLQELGDEARLTLGPLDLDEFVPGMRACWISDPEGNIIELSQGYTDE